MVNDKAMKFVQSMLIVIEQTLDRDLISALAVGICKYCQRIDQVQSSLIRLVTKWASEFCSRTAKLLQDATLALHLTNFRRLAHQAQQAFQFLYNTLHNLSILQF